MTVTQTDRGFDFAEFIDANDEACSIQQSSAIDFSLGDNPLPGTTMLWLGKESHRMHLSRKHVAELVELMQRWLDTGALAAVK